MGLSAAVITAIGSKQRKVLRIMIVPAFEFGSNVTIHHALKLFSPLPIERCKETAMTFPKSIVGAAALALASCAASANAQSVTVAGKDVQVHGSFQQGFAVSDNNNFLTMATTSG